MPFRLGAAGAAGQYQGGALADAAQADQVPRIDGHAEMQDFAACAHDPLRPDIAPVQYRRGADDQQQLRARRDEALQRAADRPSPRCAQRTGGKQRAAQRGDALFGDGHGLLGGAVLQPGQLGRHQAHFEGMERVQRQWRRALPRQRLHHGQHGAGDRERDHLDGGDQILLRHHRVVGQRADGQRLVDGVQAVDLGRIDAEQAGGLGGEVDPAGGGTRAGDQRRHQGRGQAVGRDILGHVAGFQAGANDLRAAGRAQRRQRRVVEQRALADHAVADPLAVRHDGAAGLLQRDGAEIHAASDAFAGTGAPRRTATTSAMMDRAISGAVTASMFRPTGPLMRPSASSVWPSSRSRFSRAAWVRREPSAPM